MSLLIIKQMRNKNRSTIAFESHLAILKMHFYHPLLVGFSKFKNSQNPQTLFYLSIELILRHIEDLTLFWWNKPGRNIQS